MSADSFILAELDPWERINRYPDNRPMTTDEAAIFITFSRATLERMRTDGTGPAYFQGGMRMESGTTGKDKKERPLPEGSKRPGPNQHVRYFKSDIREWMEANKVTSTMQAAIRKGLMFTSIADLVEERAYYIDPAGCIEERVEATPIDVVIERLDGYRIVWLTAIDAASQGWSNVSKHQAFAAGVDEILAKGRARVAAGIEATAIASESRLPGSRGASGTL